MLCNTYPPGVKCSKIVLMDKAIGMCELFFVAVGGGHAKMFVYGNL